jgi:hypothetical protein
MAGQALHLALEGVHEAHGRRVAGQREAPTRQPPVGVEQLQEGQAAVVAELEALAGCQGMLGPAARGRLESEQA